MHILRDKKVIAGRRYFVLMMLNNLVIIREDQSPVMDINYWAG
jgi:hypothetical protein